MAGAISMQDLENAKVDVGTISTVANSPEPTLVNRLGRTQQTLSGAIGSIAAITDRGAWSSGAAYLTKDLVAVAGVVYVCVIGHTAGDTFAGDSAKWRVYQGLTVAGFDAFVAALAAPDGAALVGDTKYGNLRVAVGTLSSSIDSVAVSEQDNGVPVFQGISAGSARLFIAGVDSLTDGAGGSDWHRYFKKIMRGHVGDGGPGLNFFDATIAQEEGASFGAAGLSAISEMDGIYYPYSLAGRGLYALNGDGNGFVNWGPASNWTSARVFYLKQAGGGTFKIGTAEKGLSALVTVNTSSAGYSLGYIDVPVGAGEGGRTLGIRSVTGKVCLFAALFTQSRTGFLWGNIARGGRKLSDVALNQNQAMRREWFAALLPSHFILNGGANDKGTRTGAQHAADLTTVVTDVRTSSPNTAVLLVQHNHIYGEESTYLPEHALQKPAVANTLNAGYADVRKLLGSYAYANSIGLMHDGTHPSDKANRSIASFYASRLGFGGNSFDEGATPFGGSGGDSVVRTGILTTKAFAAAAGVATQVYSLGLVAGYPACAVKLSVVCNRKGTSLHTVKDVLFSIGNGTTVNAANNVTTPTVIQLLKELAGDSQGIDFTLTATIVDSRCVVSVTPSSFAGNFVITGTYSIPYSPINGQQVFEE